MGRKIAIIGKAANSQMLAPFDDKSWEVWGLSNAYVDVPRWDIWFELHDWEYHRRNNMEHYEWLMKDHKKPIYAFEDNYHNAPCAKKFPLDQVMTMFGSLYNGKPKFTYWTNSPSYMMALAILQGVDTIGMWGIDMAMQDEYAYQRPSCELMIGVCLAKGINVVIPEESSLCKSRRLYGYETHAGDGYVEVRTRETLLKGRLEVANKESAQHSYNRNLMIGAMNEIETMKHLGEGYKVEERVQILQKGIENASNALQVAEQQKFVFQGALEDLTWVKTVFLT